MKKAIYKITNTINDKIYVGQTSSPKDRWKQHRCKANKGTDIGKSAIHDAMRKMGIENFRMEIIGWYEDYNEKEKYFISLFNSLVPNGYNLMAGGEEPPHYYGEEHHNSKYSQDVVDNIINDLLSHKYTQREIENKYNVSSQLVTHINRGRTHRRPGLSYPIIKTSKYHINDKTFEEICYLLKNSECTCSEIGAHYGYSTSSIKAINSGTHHHVEGIQYPIRTFRGSANSQSVEAILAKRSTKTIDTFLEM